MKINSIIFTIAFIFIELFTIAQQDEKIRFSGLTRSLISRDLNKTDTINPLNSTSGYNLIDLNTHINPLRDIEILAQLRIRNEFGSFFGSGTQITVRQLTAKGVLGNRIKFTIGDMYLKQNTFPSGLSEEKVYLDAALASTITGHAGSQTDPRLVTFSSTTDILDAATE